MISYPHKDMTHIIKINYDIIHLIIAKTCKTVKPTKRCTRPPYFIHEIKTKGRDIIGVNVFPRKLMKFPHTKTK